MDYLKTIEYRIKPMSALKITRNCSGCGRKTTYASTKQFRVNANGNLVDIWLIYQCEKCKHTYNLTIFERMKSKQMPKEQYAAFLENNEGLALRYGTDLNLFRKNGTQIDSKWLEYQYEKIGEFQEVARNELNSDAEKKDIRLVIHNPYRLKIRIDKILPELLNISRSQMKKLVQDGKISFAGTYAARTTEIIISEEIRISHFQSSGFVVQ